MSDLWLADIIGRADHLGGLHDDLLAFCIKIWRGRSQCTL